MATDITEILAGLLARNRGPDPLNPETRRQPEYGVTASLEGNALSVVLTFRRGETYCCQEWGCHLPFLEGRWRNELRGAFVSRGIAVPARLELRLSCVIEEGAVFFNLARPDPTRRGWYSFERAPAHHYEVSALEAVRHDDRRLES